MLRSSCGLAYSNVDLDNSSLLNNGMLSETCACLPEENVHNILHPIRIPWVLIDILPEIFPRRLLASVNSLHQFLFRVHEVFRVDCRHLQVPSFHSYYRGPELEKFQPPTNRQTFSSQWMVIY